MENLYIPLSVFLAIPLVYDVFPAIGMRNVKLPLIVSTFIVISFCWRIKIRHVIFNDRIEWYRNYIAASEGRKLIVPFDNVPKNKILLSWASPYEIWLLSTLENDTTESIIISDDVSTVSWAWDYRHHLITTWGVFEYDKFPPTYFKFYDTKSPYSVYYISL